MKKNSQIHLFIETELLNKLKNQAQNKELSISELCRRKVRESFQFEKIEFLLKEIKEKIECSTKYKQEVKMTKNSSKENKSVEEEIEEESEDEKD